MNLDYKLVYFLILLLTLRFHSRFRHRYLNCYETITQEEFLGDHKGIGRVYLRMCTTERLWKRILGKQSRLIELGKNLLYILASIRLRCAMQALLLP